METKRQMIQYMVTEFVRDIVPDFIEIKQDDVLDIEVGFSSWDIVELIMRCEKEFNIKMKDSEWVVLEPLTITKLANYIYVHGGVVSEEAFVKFKAAQQKNTENKVVAQNAKQATFLSRFVNSIKARYKNLVR